MPLAHINNFVLEQKSSEAKNNSSNNTNDRSSNSSSIIFHSRLASSSYLFTNQSLLRGDENIISNDNNVNITVATNISDNNNDNNNTSSNNISNNVINRGNLVNNKAIVVEKKKRDANKCNVELSK